MAITVGKIIGFVKRSFVVLVVLSTSGGHSAVFDHDEAMAQIANADVIADLVVRSRQTRHDSQRSAVTTARATIESIVSSKLPDIVVGSEIEIEIPGGEMGETGVLFSGYPHALIDTTYRASLKQLAPGRFTYVGFDLGWESSARSRSPSRNRTDGSNGDGEGAFLFWEQRGAPVPYFISRSTFGGLSEYVAAIDASFTTWGTQPGISIDFAAMGCANIDRNENDGINAVILVRDHWPFDSAAIAITRNFYVAGDGPYSGKILDSDILINAQNHKFTTTGAPNCHDVQNIVTHEVGHFIGLGHEVPPTSSDATMYAVARTEETKKRTLGPNDIEVLLDAYRGSAPRSPERNSLASCALDSGSMGCLSVGPNSDRRGLGIIMVLWILSHLALRRYSRRTRLT